MLVSLEVMAEKLPIAIFASSNTRKFNRKVLSVYDVHLSKLQPGLASNHSEVLS